MDTLFSLSGEIPAASPESPARDPGPLQQGALIRGTARDACFVRKLTGGGAVLEVEAPLADGAALELELPGGQHLRGTVAWREGAAVGLAFDAPLDVFAVIARDLVNQPGDRRRLPRVELRCPARLETGGRSEAVHTRDVSQGGAKIETLAALAPGTPARLTLDGLLPAEGTVRWCENGLAGIAFSPELGWQELMPWLKDRRDAALDRRHREPPPAPQPILVRPAAAPPPPAEAAVSLNLSARIREGTRRWGIEVTSITTRHVEFECFAAIRPGTLLWLVLPGLEGWPARLVEVDGYRFTCAFAQQLHPAVLERILVAARAG